MKSKPKVGRRVCAFRLVLVSLEITCCMIYFFKQAQSKIPFQNYYDYTPCCSLQSRYLIPVIVIDTCSDTPHNNHIDIVWARSEGYIFEKKIWTFSGFRTFPDFVWPQVRVHFKLGTFCLIWNSSIFTEKQPQSGLTQFKILVNFRSILSDK